MSQLLIDRNIDHAFWYVGKTTMGKYIKFEDFCEYILPYRMTLNHFQGGETYAEAARADIRFFVYRKWRITSVQAR